MNESNSMYRKIDTETGDVVNEFDLSSILDMDVRSIVLVDEQYAYATVSGGIAAVDHTVNPPSVSWTNSDIGYRVRRAVRTGEYVITSQGILSPPGMTTLAADSGQTVASTGQQSGSTRYTRVSSGSAGTYACRGTSLVRIDPADLSVMWEAEDVAMRGGATDWPKAVGNNGVFVPQTQKGLTAVEADSGTVRWRVRGDIFAPGISANATYAYGSGGSLLEIDIDSGEVTTEVKNLLGQLRGGRMLATVPNPSGVFLITREAVHLFS
jgi:outer membrane protein assembly factor BamB